MLTPLKLELSVLEKDSSEAVTSFVHSVHRLESTQVICCTFIVFKMTVQALDFTAYLVHLFIDLCRLTYLLILLRTHGFRLEEKESERLKIFKTCYKTFHRAHFKFRK